MGIHIYVYMCLYVYMGGYIQMCIEFEKMLILYLALNLRKYWYIQLQLCPTLLDNMLCIHIYVQYTSCRKLTKLLLPINVYIALQIYSSRQCFYDMHEVVSIE